MKDFFHKQLDNFWDDITTSKGKQKFILMVVRDLATIHATVGIDYLEGDTAESKLFTETDIENFTDGVFNSVFRDLSEIVHYYGGPGYKKLMCKATFGTKTRDYGWFLNEVVKEGGAK